MQAGEPLQRYLPRRLGSVKVLGKVKTGSKVEVSLIG